MRVPPITDSCWTRLAEGEHDTLYTSHLPTRLMLQRVLSSSDSASVKAAQLFAYFARWSDTLVQELAQIRQL